MIGPPWRVPATDGLAAKSNPSCSDDENSAFDYDGSFLSIFGITPTYIMLLSGSSSNASAIRPFPVSIAC